MVELSKMSGADLSAALERYPWFACARASLIMKEMLAAGADVAESLYNTSIIYFPDGAYVSRRMRSSLVRDYSDATLAAALREMISERPRVVMAGMDYFSRADYDSVSLSSDGAISGMARVDSAKDPAGQYAPQEHAEEELPVSETLAQIYAEQGYPDLAKSVYEKLILHSPEKSAYFASLIEKLKN